MSPFRHQLLYVRPAVAATGAALLAAALLLGACSGDGRPASGADASRPSASGAGTATDGSRGADRPFRSQLRTWPAGR